MNLFFQVEKLNCILAAAGVEVEAYIPGYFAPYAAATDVKGLCSQVGSGVGSAGAAPAAAAGAAAAVEEKEEEKEVEEEEESDEDMGFGLFD